MWPFTKRSARRLEIRRDKAERGIVWHQRLLAHLRIRPALVPVATALAASLIIASGEEPLRYRVGESIARPLTARVEFGIIDDRLTQARRLQARESSPTYYTLDVELVGEIRERLLEVHTIARQRADDAERIRQEAAALGVTLDDAAIAELARLDGDAFAQQVERATQLLTTHDVVEHNDSAARRTALEAVLVDPVRKEERRVRTSDLQSTLDSAALQRAVNRCAQALSEPLRPAWTSMLTALLRIDARDAQPRAIYVFESNRTDAAAQAAERGVAPQRFVYPVGKVLADAGPLDADELTLLQREHAAYAATAEARMAGQRAAWGRGAAAFLVALGLVGYVTFARYRRAWSTRHYLIAASLLLVLAAARAAYALWGAEPWIPIGAQGFAAVMLGVLAPQAPVFAISGGLAVLLSMASVRTVGLLIVMLVVSGALLVGLRDVRNRGKIVVVGVVGGVVALAATIAAQLAAAQPLWTAWSDGLGAAAAIMLAAFIWEGILPGIERLFHLSTNMTLLEWCDANKPLLRLMAADAPGTYNHSMMVGALAEKAAMAVGANGLLARAGAYYHDIGKINKPDYFVENQPAGASRHERLSPAMSHLIIVGHVKDGVEMAKEYGLPPALWPFIAEHHGTTLVEYFYHAANKARRPDDPEVSEASFRYPGPKPQSKETAIVMLCDAVEGAVRSMVEPTPGRIESVVKSVFRKRLMDNQLDECDLTFRELNQIEQSVIKSLYGIYHARIVYPEDDSESRAESAAENTAPRSA